MNKDLQNGRSMLEMLGVLAIVGILTVGGFNLVSKVNTNNQTNAVIDEVSSLARKVRIVARDYSSTDDGSFTKYVCTAKAYPDTMECDSCNCSAFVGSADVSYKISKADYPSLFTIEVGNLTTEMCMSMITANWGTENSTGFAGITGGSGTGSTSTDIISKAAGSCTGDSNTLTLKFR